MGGGAQMFNIRVVLDRSITIERGEEVTVFGRIDSDIFNLDDVIFNPYKDILAEKGILAANSISRVTKEGKIPIRLVNTKNKNVTMFKEIKVGTVEPILKTNVEYQNVYRSHEGNNTQHIQCILDAINESIVDKED